ncbi:MAG: ribosome maturation factor RimP [Oscillospiraceae bacterium]|nr:ribosome maturation factor RimP [Oscillospiraceae bacterium]
MPKTGKKGGSTAELAYKLAKPIADSLGLTIWDVVFEKEGAYWFLRVYIDKENEPVSMDDCESMTRPLSKALDEADPIEQNYTLEVGSPGLERALLREEHFRKYIGEKIRVRYIRETQGVKEFAGLLKEFGGKNEITVETNQGTVIEVKLSDTAYVKLHYDFSDG